MNNKTAESALEINRKILNKHSLNNINYLMYYVDKLIEEHKLF